LASLAAGIEAFRSSFGDLCPSDDQESLDDGSFDVVSSAEVATAGKLSD
jgi:hypothetical protein